MELRIDSDKVLEAAQICPSAKNILECLFPDVFRRNYKNLLKPGVKWCHSPGGSEYIYITDNAEIGELLMPGITCPQETFYSINIATNNFIRTLKNSNNIIVLKG